MIACWLRRLARSGCIVSESFDSRDVLGCSGKDAGRSRREIKKREMIGGEGMRGFSLGERGRGWWVRYGGFEEKREEEPTCVALVGFAYRLARELALPKSPVDEGPALLVGEAASASKALHHTTSHQHIHEMNIFFMHFCIRQVPSLGVRCARSRAAPFCAKC